MISMLDLAALLNALGCGLVAGAFFAFSTFVMKALGTLPPAHGIAAMQSINVAVINPWFLTPFFGTAAACVVISSWTVWNHVRTVAALVASLLFTIALLLRA
jgi:uncharacterized membrane protein